MICPTTAVIGRLGGDSLSATEFEALETHLENCPICRERVERLARGPRLSFDPAPTKPCPLPDDFSLPGFEIERVLGRGGMGVVYLARQVALDRLVAIKVLIGSKSVDHIERHHWLHEARTICRVRHPDVVPIYGVGEHDGHLYLVFGLVAGGTLQDRLGAPVPHDAAARLIEKVARTVHDIHATGVFHLDLKPSNLLLDGPSGGSWEALKPLVADFGIARIHADPGDGVVHSGRFGIEGTPAYMAPEQALGGEVGAGADIHALGAILYAMLTNRPPFQAASIGETLALVSHQDPVSPRSLVPTIPRDLETICLHCLKKNPSQRYASALDLANDLRRFRENRPIQARPASALRHASRWCVRNRGIAALVFLLFASLSMSSIAMTILWRKAENAREIAESKGLTAVASHIESRRTMRNLIALIRRITLSSCKLTADEIGGAVSIRERLPLAQDQQDTLENVLTMNDEMVRALLRQGDLDLALEFVKDTEALIPDRMSSIKNPSFHHNIYFQLMRASQHFVNAREDVVRAERILKENFSLVESLDAGQEQGNSSAWIFFEAAQLSFAYHMSGDKPGSQRVLAWTSESLERIHRKSPDDPIVALNLALGRAVRHPSESTSQAARDSFQDCAKILSKQEIPTLCAGAWLAWEVGASEFGAEQLRGSRGRDPTVWAKSTIDRIDRRMNDLGAPPSLLTEVITQIVDKGSDAGALYRKRKLVDESSVLANRLTALAQLSVARKPRERSSHYLLARALEQLSKSGWPRNDDLLIEDALRRSVESAKEAVRLDPTDMRMREYLQAIEYKHLGALKQLNDRRSARLF